MIKGYLIEKYNNMGSAYTCARLVEEASSIGITLDIIGVHDTMHNGSVLENCGKQLEPRDFVINRYKWGHIKDGINGLARKGYNHIDYYKPFIDKFIQRENLDSKYFNKPKYVLGTTQSDYNQIAIQLGKTFIAKGLEGSMGREIRLITNADDLSLLSKEFSLEKEILYEEFISSSYGRDLRLFSLRGNAIACMLRKSQNDFRANFALGATVSKYPINSDLQNIAADLYRLTNLDVIGIDLLFGHDGYYLCEINVMPGLEGIEQASGINIARAVLNMIKNDLR